MTNKKNTTILHLVRHGAVENPASIRYGRLPGIHLSEIGRRQSESLGTFFVSRPIIAIVASPLERTQQTATLLGLSLPHVRIQIDERLLEVRIPPQYEGKPEKKGFVYPIHSSQEAETPKEVQSRINSFIEEKIILHPGKEIIVVTHGDMIALYTSMAVYGDMSTLHDPYPNYGSITSLVYFGLDLREAWYFYFELNAKSIKNMPSRTQ